MYSNAIIILSGMGGLKSAEPIGDAPAIWGGRARSLSHSHICTHNTYTTYPHSYDSVTLCSSQKEDTEEKRDEARGTERERDSVRERERDRDREYGRMNHVTYCPLTKHKGRRCIKCASQGDSV